METILLRYRVEGERDGEGEGECRENAMMLQVHQGKELYLLDILQHFITRQEALPGSDITSYQFLADTGDRLYPLTSPSCVVPFSLAHQNTVLLLLRRSAAPSVVPIGQVPLFLEASRRALYSDKTNAQIEQELERMPARTKPEKTHARAPSSTTTTTSTSNSGDSSRSATTKINSNTNSRNNAQQAGTEQRRRGQDNEANQPSHAGTSTTSTSTSTSSGNRSNSSNSSSGSSSNRPLQSTINKLGLDDVNLQAAAEGAKEALGNVAKSFMGFAAFAAKKVEDAVKSSGVMQAEYVCGRTSVRSIRVLAEGAFGTVHLVEASDNSNKKFALKVIICQSKEQVDDAHAELDALRKFSHEHIIKLVDHASTVSKQHGAGARQVLMLFPLYPTTAWDRIEAKNADPEAAWCFSERQVIKITIGMAKALQVMHDLGYAHNDVKPHNVLLTESGEPILMDFGSVGPAQRDASTRSQALKIEEEAASKTTAAYRAPELTSTPYPSRIDERTDIFSLGCCVYCLAFGRSPFESPREGVSRLAILNGKYTFPDHYRNRDCSFSKAVIGIIEQCLCVVSEDRLQCCEVLEALCV